MKHVALVIVNWNGYKDTVACLASVHAMKSNGVSLSTFVVDNGSTDDSVKKIAKEFPWVRLIALDTNTGFTGGNNAGMRAALSAGAQYVWLLNNDTIVDKNALSLVNAFSDSSAGIAGSKIFFAKGHEFHKDRYSQKEQGKVIWYAGGIIDWDNMYASHRGVDEVDRGQYDEQQTTPFVSGCSMMIRADVLRKVGLLEESFYLYLEDVDLCLRVKRAGFRLVYYPASVIWHVNAGSSGGAGNPVHEYYLTRNRLRVGVTYAPLRTKAALMREASRFFFGKNKIKRQAVSDFFFGRWGKWNET